MKRTLLLLTIAALCAMPTTASAKADTTEVSTFRLSYMLLRHQQQKDYISAMEDATLMLSRNEKNFWAKNYVHRHWDDMMQQMQRRLDKHAETDDIEDSQARLVIYEQLTNIESNLHGVTMPLKGNNWTWQPEILYTQGDYNAERQHLMSLYRRKAAEALRAYDTETARLLYDQALHSTVLLPQEIDGQRLRMRDDINAIISDRARRYNIHELLFAYELCSLSLYLDPQQAKIAQQQKQLQTDICRRYQDLAQEALQAGDSIRAEEYNTSALDWKIQE